MNPAHPAETIYLDHAATTPLREEVLQAMHPYLTEHFGNAGSIHRFGRRAKRAIEEAREQVAALLNADPRDLLFTSGGTEANNLAVRGGARDGREVLVSAVEHHSVLHAAKAVAVVPVDEQGRVCVEELVAMLEPRQLVSTMQGNNETGTIQPIGEIGKLCRERGALLHTDAVQSAGKIPLDVSTLPVDLLSLSAHKLYGPKGVGALYIRRGLALAPLLTGGSQERGRRAGTENVAGIVGFGVACQLAQQSLAVENDRLRQLRDELEAALLARVPGSWVNGSRTGRLPHLLNMGFPGLEGESVLWALDQAGIAVSTGSACTSGAIDASHVLLAMGQDQVRAHSGVRFSLGASTTRQQLKRVCDVLVKTCANL